MDGEILANGTVNVLIFRGYLVQLHTFDQALTLAVVVVVCVGGVSPRGSNMVAWLM